MNKAFVSASTDNFVRGAMEFDCDDEIESVEVIINGKSLYFMSLPCGVISKNLDLAVKIKGE